MYGCAGGVKGLGGTLAEYIVADARLIAPKQKLCRCAKRRCCLWSRSRPGKDWNARERRPLTMCSYMEEREASVTWPYS